MCHIVEEYFIYYWGFLKLNKATHTHTHNAFDCLESKVFQTQVLIETGLSDFYGNAKSFRTVKREC